MQIIKDLQKQVRNFFGISSPEANAFLILLPLMIILLLLIPFYHQLFPSHETDLINDKQQFQNLIAELQKKKMEYSDKSQDQTQLLSAIDPNVAKFNDLLLLEIDTILAARIIKYRNSGGKFTFKEDLLKIYGFNEEKLNFIHEWISLPSKPAEKENSTEEIILASEKKELAKEKPKESPAIIPFDINTVDSTTLQQIRGIGPVLSARIIKYRELLGGFADTVQYKEVYGLNEEVLKQLFTNSFISDNYEVQLLNINKADPKTLAAHPYISWKIANAIVAYRNQHGNFENVEQLKEIKLIDHKTMKKIVPYLSL